MRWLRFPKKDAVYGIVVSVLAFVILQRFIWVPVFVFFLESGDYSWGVSRIKAHLFIVLLGALVGIVFLFALGAWRRHRSAKAEIKEIEEKVAQTQGPKSGHNYLKFFIYFIAGSLVLSAAASFINREPGKNTSGEFEPEPEWEPGDREEVQKVFYVKFSAANVRSCESTSCAVVGTLGQNSTISSYYGSLEEVPEWMQISYTDTDTGKDVSGYVSKTVLSETQMAAAPSTPRTTAPPQKISVAQEPTIVITREPVPSTQSAGNPAELQGTWKLVQIAIWDQSTNQYDIRSTPASTENYNVIQGSQSCSYVFENGARISGPHCSSFTADSYVFTDDSGPSGWAMENGALIFTVNDSKVSALVGVPLGTKLRLIRSTLPADTPQQSSAPPGDRQNITFDSARCSVEPGYAWPPKSSSGGGGIFLGVPIDIEFAVTVSGPIDSVLNLTGSGFPSRPRAWTKSLPCWTAGTSCSVYQRVSGDPSEWKFALPAGTSARSPESFPISSLGVTVRLGYQDPKYGNDVMLLDSLISKSAKVEIVSCQPTGSDLSAGSPCECRVVEQ